MSVPKFLMGRAELLTYHIDPPKRNPNPTCIYTLVEAQDALFPEISATNEVFSKIPKLARPGDIVVAKMMMHPAYIAKSFFPNTFLREAGLISVGSHTVRAQPRKFHKKTISGQVETTELFVAGSISNFLSLQQTAARFTPDSGSAKDFSKLEHINPFTAADRIIEFGDKESGYFEVGLHLIPEYEDAVRSSFLKYAISNGFKVYDDLVFTAGQLLFLPVKGDPSQLEKLADFTLMRVVRPVPKLRGTRPIWRGAPLSIGFSLPNQQPLSNEPSVAILDGGLPATHVLDPWVNRYFKSDDEAEDVEDYIGHGLAVTSAFLFGPIDPNKVAQRPFSYVNHHRVLDSVSDQDPTLELYRTLGHIEAILLSRQYQFINLSLGPDLPIEDTNLHAWTSVIDELLSDGETFLSIAAGNNGERDSILGFNRVQVPSDCVNGIAVGAADKRGAGWQRAQYSAVGPGRSPGRRKPDLVAFGGSPQEYFHVPAPNGRLEVIPTCGTSFASPLALRSAVGVRAVLGPSIHPLTIKALLVHTSSSETGHNPDEIGWGKVPEDVNQIITCPDGVARIVYQGELKPGKYLRAPIPLPAKEIQGKVTITATFCYASKVDPQDASAYTKAGLGITFRPNASKVDKGAKNPRTRSFFSQSEFLTEPELRSDLGKWETVLHASDTMMGKTLNDASFDIHYGARDCGGTSTNASKIRYALVITLHTPKHLNVYDEILANHKVLIPLQPQISVPIQI